MNLSERIEAFSQLGANTEALTPAELATIAARVLIENPWFTKENVVLALSGIRLFLTKDALTQWTSNYNLEPKSSKTVGVAFAGNIPLVGFHDFLAVLISGHSLVGKLSHQDSYLMMIMKNMLLSVEPRFEQRIQFAERLKNMDAVIATGSDNTSRYFEYYFRNIPHIIRKNRSSAAVIVGEESVEELKELGKDIFTYYGLGCRNVSKIFVPEQYDFSTLIKALDDYSSVGYQHKYMNNYDYQKSILIMNNIPFLDTGFLILKEEAALVSPLSVVYYEYYADQHDLQQKLTLQANKLQCIASANAWYSQSVGFGKTQLPSANEYADQIDTLEFLSR